MTLAYFDIGAKRVPGDRVIARPMNFGQPIAGETPLRYSLRLAIREFCDRTEPQYRQCVAELQEDIAAVGTEDEGVDVAVMRAGWPPLETLLRDHTPLASEFLKVYLAIEILNVWASGAQEVNDYLLNSFDEVTVAGNEVTITGICYRVSR
ncbi:hypothetical protein [Nucisporomicrobium flavum]|uniref:hypothetical protein n=1 Tax=Nucisporomicrobium flavum TaxID=2785915 RepID=UPI0018F3AFA4|nr:hypothetical protein [Nucisporomicrobium flavum]